MEQSSIAYAPDGCESQGRESLTVNIVQTWEAKRVAHMFGYCDSEGKMLAFNRKITYTMANFIAVLNGNSDVVAPLPYQLHEGVSRNG